MTGPARQCLWPVLPLGHLADTRAFSGSPPVHLDDVERGVVGFTDPGVDIAIGSNGTATDWPWLLDELARILFTLRDIVDYNT
jgi:hypothetical protein